MVELSQNFPAHFSEGVHGNGSSARYRERKVYKKSKSVVQRWGENRERFLLTHGRPAPKKEVPTLKEFAPRFLDGHARANRHKPSGIAAKESIMRVHLIPALGTRRLDQITTEHVQLLKQRLATLAPKTVNNTLTVLSTLLRRAVDWNVIAQMPCVIRLVKAPKLYFCDVGLAAWLLGIRDAATLDTHAARGGSN